MQAVARVVVVVVATVAGCRGGARARPTIAPAPLTVVEAGPARTEACEATCAARYPSAPDPDGYRAYCAATCAPAEAPSATCAAGCRASHEPGAYLDDDGEYHRYEDERDDAQRAADDAACDAECATVPELDGATLAGCVDACVAAGGNEGGCQTDCDPDPYDTCRYQPCD